MVSTHHERLHPVPGCACSSPSGAGLLIPTGCAPLPRDSADRADSTLALGPCRDPRRSEASPHCQGRRHWTCRAWGSEGSHLLPSLPGCSGMLHFRKRRDRAKLGAFHLRHLRGWDFQAICHAPQCPGLLSGPRCRRQTAPSTKFAGISTSADIPARVPTRDGLLRIECDAAG